MSENLEEIVHFLAKMILSNYILIASKSELRLLNILWEHAKKRNIMK